MRKSDETNETMKESKETMEQIAPEENKEDRRSDLHTCACRRERQCERRGDLRKSS